MEKDGFRFNNLHNEDWFLQLESKRLEECIRYCNRQGVKWVHASPFHGYLLKDLDCFHSLKNIEGVHLQNSANREISDFVGLYGAPRLRYICADFTTPLDFSLFPFLTELTTHFTPENGPGIFNSRGLTLLCLAAYNTKHRSLQDLKNLIQLRGLSVFSSSITSVSGIGDLPALTDVRLGYCYKLSSVGPLAALAGLIERFEIYACKRAADLYDLLKSLKRVKRIIISKCGSLPSLDFVHHLPNLEFLSFDDTNILDGDMTPCLRLKYAGFLNKPHYSHKWDDIRRQLGIPPLTLP